MKCQILFSRKNRNNISKCCLLKFLPSMQSVKYLAQDKVFFFFRPKSMNSCIYPNSRQKHMLCTHDECLAQALLMSIRSSDGK